MSVHFIFESMKSAWDGFICKTQRIICSSAAYAAVTLSINVSNNVTVACDNQPTSFVQQFVSFLP